MLKSLFFIIIIFF